MPDEMIFECPICESQVVSVGRSSDLETVLLCGTCGQEFKISQARVVDHLPMIVTSSPKKKSDPLPPPVPPKSIGVANQGPGPIKSVTDSKSPAPSLPTEPRENQAEQVSGDKTSRPVPMVNDWVMRNTKEAYLRQAAKRKRGKQRIFWGIFTFLLLGSLVGAGIYYWPKIMAAGLWSKASGNKPNDSQVGNTEVSNPETEPTQKIDENRIPLHFGKLSYRSQPEAETVWNKIYPTLFELSIKRDGTTERGVGVLIDSRGWLVTTLSSIVEADEVQCRNIPNQPTVRGTDQGLLDNARGILAEDQQHDLAIIQINRAQVNALNGPDVAKTIPVAGSYVWNVTVPGPEHFAWIGESHVTFDSMSRDITPSLKSQLEANGLTALPNWMVLDAPTPLAAGSAFFSSTGELLGLAAKNSKSQQAFVAFPEQISILLKKVGKDVKPFRSTLPATDVAEPNPDETPAVEPGDIEQPAPTDLTAPLVEEESLIRAESQELNDNAGNCAAFGWVPDNLEQFEQLYRLMTSFGVAATRIHEREIRLRDLNVLREQIKFWRTQGSILFSNVPERVHKQINDLGDWNVGDRPSAPNLAYIEMSYPANLGNTGHVAKIIGTDVYLSFEAEPDRFVMERNSIWLVAVVEIDPQLLEIKVHERDETKVMARKVKVAHAERLTQ